MEKSERIHNWILAANFSIVVLEFEPFPNGKLFQMERSCSQREFFLKIVALYEHGDKYLQGDHSLRALSYPLLRNKYTRKTFSLFSECKQLLRLPVCFLVHAAPLGKRSLRGINLLFQKKNNTNIKTLWQQIKSFCTNYLPCKCMLCL